MGQDYEALMMSPSPPDFRLGTVYARWLENPVPVRLRGPVSRKPVLGGDARFLV